MGLNISPSIWPSDINAILNCLKTRNIVKQSWMIFYCLLNQKFSYHKIRKLTKGIINKQFENIPREVSYLGQICITWKMRYL